MSELSDFERGQIVGAQLSGLSVRDTAQLCDVSSRTVIKVMSVFNKHGYTVPAKKNHRQKLQPKRIRQAKAAGRDASEKPVSDSDVNMPKQDEPESKITDAQIEDDE